jgi:hypothetical protein
VTAVPKSCDQNHAEGIRKYLKLQGVESNKANFQYSFKDIRQTLHDGKPLIMSFRPPSHIVLVRGYTDQKCLVVNDTWKDLTHDTQYSNEGEGAVYCLDEEGRVPDKDIEFFYQITPE